MAQQGFGRNLSASMTETFGVKEKMRDILRCPPEYLGFGCIATNLNSKRNRSLTDRRHPARQK